MAMAMAASSDKTAHFPVGHAGDWQSRLGWDHRPGGRVGLQGMDSGRILALHGSVLKIWAWRSCSVIACLVFLMRR